MKTHRSINITAALLVLVLSGRVGRADDPSWRQPLSNRNQFPIAIQFIYLKPERATVLDKRDYRLVFNFDYSNTIIDRSNDRESLALDMEHLSTEIRVQAGLGKGFELGVWFPFYVMYGGFLDPFISSYHGAFGFPNEVRGRTPDNLFQYRYEVGDSPALERNKGSFAIGDITFSAKKALLENDKNAVALRAAVKLPSGSAEKLTGSGKADFGIGLAASRVGKRFGGYFNINYQFLGKPESLDTKNYLSIMAAFDWRFRNTLVAVFQYEVQQSFLKSQLPLLARPAHQLVLGLRWRPSDRFQYEWRLAEDISEAGPDITVAFEWTIHWAGSKT